MMNTVEQLRYFMEPKSVAIIGVPRRTGRLSLNMVENLVNYGYTGKIYPVNPSAEEIYGVKSYPTLSAVPGEVELVLIGTPPNTVIDMTRECARKGAKAVIVLTQGFADYSEAGRVTEKEMVKIVKGSGGRLLGPNSIGAANDFASFTTSFARPEKTYLPVGLICQTGSFFTGTQTFIPSGKCFDLANTADIDFCDCLEYFGQDPQIKVITLYVEGINDGPRFLEVASRVTRVKPVFALKSGRTAYGLKAAASHTAQMTGRDEIYNAAFRQCGVIRVDDIEELHDLARTFASLPLMKGDGVCVVTMSGSGGVMAADACSRYGLKMAELSPQTRNRLTELSSAGTNVSNPVDIWPILFRDTKTDFSKRYPELNLKILEIVAQDPGVSGILFFAGVFSSKDHIDPTPVVSYIADKYKDKPVVCVLHGRNPEAAACLEKSGKSAVFPSSDRAIRALGRLRQYAVRAGK